MTENAEKAGADATLQVVPYYNKPNQSGLFNHFSEIARNTSLPLILYNIPGRSVVNLTVETIANLERENKNITLKNNVFSSSLNAKKSNAILICHALTGDQFVTGKNPITNRNGWWENIVGPNKILDTNKYFIIFIYYIHKIIV